jgi:hypothetical protein
MAQRQYTIYQNWAGSSRPAIDVDELLQRTVFVGWPDCREDGRRPTEASNRVLDQPKPADPALSPLIQLSLSSLERHDGLISFHVDIRNTSSDWLWQDPKAPISLSWRFVPVGDEGTGIQVPSWTTRQGIVGNIAPGAVQTEVTWTHLPQRPGLYRLEVSLVEEWSFWFHEKGMRIATSAEPISVP